MRSPSPQRLRRLREELAEAGLDLDGSEPWHALAITEIDYALRPSVHERRVPSYGAIVAPSVDPDLWEQRTELRLALRPVGDTDVAAARRYADGQSSWLVHRLTSDGAWAVFDRPAGSERDLVVLAEALGAVIVQRHPNGAVRIVGTFGVLRWNGLTWHHEQLVSAWFDLVRAYKPFADVKMLETLLEFAVHDLGARGIGATLVFQPDLRLESSFEPRLPTPPALQICRATDLAPLRHALAQIDGASLFDSDGTLRAIGVRLVPSAHAEMTIAPFRGTRHTSARRYSADDPSATVIVVSEDGPVTVMRAGQLRGASALSVPDATGDLRPADETIDELSPEPA
jgi:DNA integrity scanning protein DisA with diadenylate cyclase activity